MSAQSIAKGMKESRSVFLVRKQTHPLYKNTRSRIILQPINDYDKLATVRIAMSTWSIVALLSPAWDSRKQVSIPGGNTPDIALDEDKTGSTEVEMPHPIGRAK